MAQTVKTATRPPQSKHPRCIEMLKPGDKAPDFRVKADDDKDVSLPDFRGKRVLLFFFPKANTSG